MHAGIRKTWSSDLPYNSSVLRLHALRGMHVPEYCIARMANRTIMSSGFRLSVSPLLDRSCCDGAWSILRLLSGADYVGWVLGYEKHSLNSYMCYTYSPSTFHSTDTLPVPVLVPVIPIPLILPVLPVLQVSCTPRSIDFAVNTWSNSASSSCMQNSQFD